MGVLRLCSVHHLPGFRTDHSYAHKLKPVLKCIQKVSVHRPLSKATDDHLCLPEALEAHKKEHNPVPSKHTLNFMEVSL